MRTIIRLSRQPTLSADQGLNGQVAVVLIGGYLMFNPLTNVLTVSSAGPDEQGSV